MSVADRVPLPDGDPEDWGAGEKAEICAAALEALDEAEYPALCGYLRTLQDWYAEGGQS